MIEDIAQIDPGCSMLRQAHEVDGRELLVFDREAGGANIAAEGIELRALFTMSQLRQSVGSGSSGG